MLTEDIHLDREDAHMGEHEDNSAVDETSEVVSAEGTDMVEAAETEGGAADGPGDDDD